MGLYISDDYGLGDYEMVLAALATDAVEKYLEDARKRAERMRERRRRASTRFNEARWGLPDRNRS